MLRKQWNKIRSAIILAFDHLLTWIVERRGYALVRPDVFRLAVLEIVKAQDFVNKSGSLTTARGKIPRARKKLNGYLGRFMLYVQQAVDMCP